MTDRFDLEQQILRAWHIVDDIELLMKNYMDTEMNKDQVANYLLGLSTIYNLKFEEIFETFETLLKRGDIK